MKDQVNLLTIRPEDLKSGISQIRMQKNIIIVKASEIEWCENYPEDFNETFQPITLSEEILLEIGFKKKKEEFIMKDNPLVKLYLFADNSAVLNVDGSQIKKVLFFLHEIQDLYFFLTDRTGKLIYKETKKTNKDER